MMVQAIRQYYFNHTRLLFYPPTLHEAVKIKGLCAGIYSRRVLYPLREIFAQGEAYVVLKWRSLNSP
jgi:hypothetical protein